MNAHKKIVFFENINSTCFSILRTHLKNDCTVYFFKIDDGLKKNKEITKYIKEKKIVDITSVFFEWVAIYPQAAFLAHENIDIVFNRYFSRSLSIQWMRSLLNFQEIEIVYKKNLLITLEKVYRIQLKINEIIKDFDSLTNVFFYPENNLEIHHDSSSPLQKNVHIIHHHTFRFVLQKKIQKMRSIFHLFVPIYYLLKKTRKISSKKNLKKFKVAITVDNPRRLFGMRYLTDTIFIDENELPKEDVLFIDHSTKGINTKDYQEHGWNYTNIFLDKETITSGVLFHKIIRRFLPTWSKTVLYSFFENLLIIETNKTILLDYIIWNIFIDNYIIENYTKRLLPDTASKVHILSQSGIKTWLIFPDNTSLDHYLGWDEKKQNQTLFSFMYYDYAVMYGGITTRFFEKHRNFIKQYISNGVLFAQIVQEIRNGKLSSPLFDIVKQKKLPKKIIGIFDTSVADNGTIRMKDGVRFGNDIMRLLDDFPNVGIIFKAMKWPGWIPELDSVYEKIQNHERCLLFYMWDTDKISASEVIAVSDLVISAAYTSPSAEALGARTKAIYYDVVGHDIGERYYYDRYPHFVAHNYEELKKFTNYWLNECTQKEFEEFLITYVKDEIDPYLDGKALTRLRKLLMD